MIVWKVTLQDFITLEDIEPFLVETEHDELQAVERVIHLTSHLTKKRRLRLVERVGTLSRQSFGPPQRFHESTGQGY